MPDTKPVFDARAIAFMLKVGHQGWLDLRYRDHGPDWCEIELPWREELVGEPDTGILASGPIIALMDVATSLAAWSRMGQWVPIATLDLRVDYMRPATKGATIIGHGECYRLTRSVAFVRGVAHDGDPNRPVANVAGTFMRTGPVTP